ncbi:MAG: helix-turn-helix domain-containing protein [Anaeroplasmataceae bacterium]|nr:helix-turn-helix domain-containing protein [Anaeroplasmataceae bacterium]
MIHKNIKRFRLQRNWTQEDLASQLEVTRQTISKWEQGINEPDISTLQKLSVLFEVSIDELLGKEISSNKNNPQSLLKITNLISIAICIIFSFSLIIFTRYLEDWLPMHWNIKGEVDRYGSKWEWLLLLFCFVLFLIIDLIAVHWIQKKTKYTWAELWTIKITCWICQIVFLAIFLIATIPHLKEGTWFPMVIAMIYTFLLPVTAFCHPRITPSNQFYGVRTSFTLSNLEGWNLMNRFSAYALSVICLITIIFNLCINEFWYNLISVHFILIGFILIGIFHSYVKRKLK